MDFFYDAGDVGGEIGYKVLDEDYENRTGGWDEMR